MARIILKWRYLKPGGKKHNQNLVKYIATRDGVEKIDDSWKHLPVTAAQEQLICQLIKDFPEVQNSYEYQDYCSAPNRGNASETINRAMEENLDRIDTRENYVKYIARRPRVEKIGKHGLFTDDNIHINLNDVAKEVAAHDGVIMTQILSLRREDAARLGYETGDAWRTLIRNHTVDMAQAMNIPLGDLRWYAAFHNESHHPHCHIIMYSVEGDPFVTEKRLLKLKSAFGSEIFRQERMESFQQQTKIRDSIAAQTSAKMNEIAQSLNKSFLVSENLAAMIAELNQQLKNTKGKKQYGYLTQGGRNLVNGIIDELERDERITELYELWYRQHVSISTIYQDDPPERIPLSQNKSFHKLRNIIVKEILNMDTDPAYARSVVQQLDDEMLREQHIHAADEHREFQSEELVQNDSRYEEPVQVTEDNEDSEERAAYVETESFADWWTERYLKASKKMQTTPVDSEEYRQALHHLHTEAQNGNGLAAYDLGKMYLFGEGVEKDNVRMREYLSTAAFQGVPHAKFLLDNYENLAVTLAAFKLFVSVMQAIRDDINVDEGKKIYIVDQKIRRKTIEKKLAQGQKLG